MVPFMFETIKKNDYWHILVIFNFTYFEFHFLGSIKVKIKREIKPTKSYKWKSLLEKNIFYIITSTNSFYFMNKTGSYRKIGEQKQASIAENVYSIYKIKKRKNEKSGKTSDLMFCHLSETSILLKLCC